MKEGNSMFIYWIVILVLLAKVFTFFETNKLKIVKRGKVEHKVFSKYKIHYKVIMNRKYYLLL